MEKKRKKRNRKEMSLTQIEQEMNSDAFILRYEYAIAEIERLLKKIADEKSSNETHKKIEYITMRIKSPRSAVEKLRRKGREISITSMERNLNDIAGVCVVCPYYEDVYDVAEELLACEHITLLKKKDFIKNPKPSGYRSLHLIICLPDELARGEKLVRVEVQFRTITMDAWARLDHELHYKKKIKDVERISMELRKCSDSIAQVDDTMQKIRTELKKL